MTLPLTEAQEGLWFAQKSDPRSPILNTGQYLDLRGPADRAALIEAARRVLAETEALRLRVADGPQGPVQRIGPAVQPGFLDLSTAPEPMAEAMAAMQADSRTAHDLAEGVAAITVIALGPERHLIYERVHHIALDGYGMVLVTNRLAAQYDHLTGAGPQPPALPGYAVALAEDADWRASGARAAARDWWLERLRDLPEVLGPAPGRAVSAHDFLRDSRSLDPALLARLEGFAGAHGLNWTEVLTGLTGAYLARWTGGAVVAGLPFMARMGRPVARLPAMVMNVLPQVIAPDEDAPTADWLARLGRDMAAARRHGRYRSEYLRRELGLVGGTRRLYGPLINIQPFDLPPRFAGLEVSLNILGAGAVDDLTLTFRGTPRDGMLFEVDANPALYSAAETAAHAERLSAFLDAALQAPTLATVPTAAPDEIAAQTALTEAARHPLTDTTLPALFLAQAAATPDAPALQYGEAVLSYGALAARCAALAGGLRIRGAGPGRIVAVALPRGLDLPVALMATMLAGAAYLPLDPDHPPERLAGILAQAQPVAVLTTAGIAARLPADAPLLTVPDWPAQGGTPPPAPPAPQDMAYVIFTSGSTGAPKGVVIDQRAIVNRLLWMADHYGFGPGDRVLQKTPATFDVSVWEFFLPLITGGTLVMAPPGAHRDPSAIAALIRDHAITALHFVPSMLAAFLDAPASAGLSVARVFCSGEALPAALRDRFHRRMRARLVNLYGPTEAAVDVSHWDAAPEDRSDPVPIGWPVWNTRLAVLDERMRPCPPGLAGRLWLGGVQLARGYLGRDDLTAERFVTHAGERLYDSGDLARLRPDGAVAYLGRADDQIKLRGLRIELGEIDAAIRALNIAQDCAVVERDDGAGLRLVAYLTGSTADLATLNAGLSATLPDYMLPSALVLLEALPLSANGKLDRKALPPPVAVTADGRAAGDAAERLIAGLFAEILNLPEPPPADADFFTLGGDSLSAVRLSLRIEEETGHDPGLGSVIEAPTVAALARAAAQGAVAGGLGVTLKLAEAGDGDGDGDASVGADGAGRPPAPGPARQPRERTAPLFLIHPAGGLGWGYRRLARAVGGPVWAIQHPGLADAAAMPGSITDLTRRYAAEIAAVAPEGPIHLAGWSMGGIIAQDLAAELVSKGRRVGAVALLDAYPADAWREQPDPDPAAALRALLAIAGHDPDAHPDLDSRDKVVAFLRQGDTALGALPGAVLDGVVRVVTETNRLIREHQQRHHPGRLIHVRAGLDHAGTPLSAEMWTQFAHEVTQHSVPFLHAQMVSPEAVAAIAPILRREMVD